MDISKLLNMTAKLSVPYRAEVVEIEYHCEKITPTYQAQLKKLAEDEAAETVDAPDAKLLSDLLVGWDISDNGEAYPPTFDNLKGLSFTFLATLARAILNDLVNPTHATTPTS
jgi:hypothetical protein